MTGKQVQRMTEAFSASLESGNVNLRNSFLHPFLKYMLTYVHKLICAMAYVESVSVKARNE